MKHSAGRLALALFLTAQAARALDPFEIQVYDGTANSPGAPGLELHANHTLRGTRVTHVTFEPSYGLFSWWELGAYFQTAITNDPELDYGGVKLRSKFVTPPGWQEHWRLGGNFELSLVPQKYDPDQWGAEVRPIVAWEDERWLLAANPIVSIPLAGPDSRRGPDFEPVLKGMLKTPALGVGFEYYGGLGPFADLVPSRGTEQYLYVVTDMLAYEDVELEFGVGQGLTTTSDRLVFKLICGYTFERRPETR